MTSNEKAIARFGEWAHYALEDEQIIVLAMKEDGPPNQICLHAQQMGEKYLKGFLSFHGQLPPKTHQFNELIAECKKIDESFAELRADAKLLNGFYIETRYPGDIEEFSLQDAREGYEAAKNIKNFVLAKIESAR